MRTTVPGKLSSYIQEMNGGVLIDDSTSTPVGVSLIVAGAATFLTPIYSMPLNAFGVGEYLCFIFGTIVILFGFCCLISKTIFIDRANKTITWTWILWKWNRTRVRHVTDFEKIQLSRSYSQKRSRYTYYVDIKGVEEEFTLATFGDYDEACADARRIIDAVGLPYEYLE